MIHRTKSSQPMILFSISILLMWIALTGMSYATKHFLITSTVLALTLLFISYINLLPRSTNFKLSASLGYFFWLIKEIYKSSFQVIKIIWSKQLNLKPALEWIDSIVESVEVDTMERGTPPMSTRRETSEDLRNLKSCNYTQPSDLGDVIYSNSITLTPGTIAVDIQDNKILVHALDISSINDLAQNEMSSRVKNILC